MKTEKDGIRESYCQLGSGFAKLYDGMLTYSSPAGIVMNKMMWGFDKNTTDEWIHDALGAIPQNFSGKLLEVPVGTGVLTMPLYEKLPEARITCLDYSEEMMANARRRADQRKLKNIELIQGDVGNLPFADESFDIVLSLNGFHAFPDKEAAYQETYRVLKPGGIFCGCFYIQGEKKRTDFFVRHMLQPKKSFTPPYETKDSLNERLSSMYSTVKVKSIHAVGIFRCLK